MLAYDSGDVLAEFAARHPTHVLITRKVRKTLKQRPMGPALPRVGWVGWCASGVIWQFASR